MASPTISQRCTFARCIFDAVRYRSTGNRRQIFIRERGNEGEEDRDKSGLPCEGFLASYDSPIRDSRRFRVLQKLQDLDQIVTSNATYSS